MRLLLIERNQIAALEKAALRQFEDRMVTHGREFAPRHAQVAGEEQFRAAVRGAMKSADKYGFARRGPIRLYVELALLRGCGFDTDPQYAALGGILRSKVPEMQRAEKLHAAALEYRARVVVARGGVSVYKALGDLLAFAHAPLAVEGDPGENMIYAMGHAYPRKAAYVGETGLQRLIRRAKAEAGRFGLTTFRDVALLGGLMFILGHRCADDPLYPWIHKTLRAGANNPAAAAERLQKEAQAWIKAMSGTMREPALA